MDETEIKYVVEAALLAAGRPLTLERLSELFIGKGPGVDRATLKRVLDALAADYQGRGIEVGEVSSGYRIQVRRSMSDWLVPLWEEKAPRYTRALLETLALVAYRQPITRAEIEEVRGVVVSTNIMRTLLERSWVRVVGHRDVPGKPAMFGTTREFLDYFGLKKLEELPPLAELKDGVPELSPQTDLIESLEAEARGELPPAPVDGDAPALGEMSGVAGDDAQLGETGGEGTFDSPDTLAADADEGSDDDDDDFDAPPGATADATGFDAEETSDESDDALESESANVIPLRATSNGNEPAE
jgi:segregation and condensation protein B